MPWLIGTGVYALLTLLGEQLLNDPDSYWHLVVGRWIVEHGAVPPSAVIVLVRISPDLTDGKANFLKLHRI